MNPESSGRAATEGKPSTPGRVACPMCGCSVKSHAPRIDKPRVPRQPRRRPRRHGTHSGFNSHRLRGEAPCEACWDGERAYQRVAKRRHRAAAKARDRALVDEVAVERACKGEQVRLTRLERAEAARRLAAQGATRTEIAERLRMNGIRVHQVLGDVA